MTLSPTKTPTMGARPANGPAEIPLTQADFRFVYHGDARHIIDPSKRPYRLLTTTPSLTTYDDAIYTPAIRNAKQKLGCIYDHDLKRIEETVTRRNRHDMVYNTDPLRFEGDPAALPVYDRPVLYMGILFSHFSHFLIESIAQWWGLTEDLAVDRYLFHISDMAYLERPYVKAMLEAAGINRDNMVIFDKPTRLRRVIVPQTSCQIHSHIYTKNREIFNKLALALGADEVTTSDQPVYLSRARDTHGVRRYIGEVEIEEFLAQRGVRIAYPGEMPFHEQVKLINSHRTIIGFQGGQMLNIAFALEPKQVVYLTDNRVWGSSLLVDRCFDHTSTYVKVSDTENVLHEAYRAIVRRLTGKRKKVDGFSRAHRVDHARATAWLAEYLANRS